MSHHLGLNNSIHYNIVIKFLRYVKFPGIGSLCGPCESIRHSEPRHAYEDFSPIRSTRTSHQRHPPPIHTGKNVIQIGQTNT